ncbi:L,D-transpeptidase family protein [Corynebacterium sp. zg254]|uniref:L,D-transpeptidase n=1 Tax=Corynebacterium zhongnanshanii TaxID=2768834 RepID=A0ABQ6VE08_9CORY|nr:MULTISPECIES: Ig-like domain-containing protein [Corynebacterium]KAB3520978.1 L,D-transpeptidase [Corynebacterium zhongnanshanii]MCR5914612.1 L,D-transpeptidase family protein [Corynebacterium sp. zg254]
MRRIASTHARKAVVATSVAAFLGLTAACTIDRGDSGSHNGDSASHSQGEDGDSIGLTASVKDNAKGVKVTDTISVEGKDMSTVTLTNDEGTEVAGEFNGDKSKWSSTEKLGYNRTYTLTAKSGDKTLKKTFSTTQADYVADSALSPLDQSTVGIAQSVALFFDTPVSNKKAVQDAITVETSNNTEGAFYWLTDQSLRWRPKEFWKPGTEVTVKSNLYGVEVSDGVFGDADREASFTIGDDVRAEVDDATKTMTVTKNGEVIKTMPVSNGRDSAQWATPNGTYTVGDQYDTLTMDSNTYGLAPENGGYVTPVNYATQMSWSGIYIHGAPWSVYAQGNTNTSHGCVNVSDANAQWVYENLKRGDVVIVKNTVGGQLDGHDGLGDWQIPWEEWSKGNA